MAPLRLEKGGLRGLAVAESYAPGSGHSLLAGVVMRRDLRTDGYAFGRTRLGGDGSAAAILGMYRRLRRTDISYILVSGMIISSYDMLDVREIHGSLRIPAIGVSYRGSGGLGACLERRFPGSDRAGRYRSLGARTPITAGGRRLFVRCAGCTPREAELLLDSMTEPGGIPEPLRAARLLARRLALGGGLAPVDVEHGPGDPARVV